MFKLTILRPAQGWTTVGWELGIVTLGVLIALALGAVASDIGWRIEVRGARERLREEIAFNLALLDEAERVRPCISRRLVEIEAILGEASRTRQLPAIASIGAAPTYSWPRGIWESQLAAGTISHYPKEEAAKLARLYGRFEGLRGRGGEAYAPWKRLNMLVGPGRPLDAGSEAVLYEALAEAKVTAFYLANSVAATRRLTATFGHGYARMGREQPMPVDDGLCSPMGETP